ncbi:hypothetical protein BD408DRAFT_430018 [Parasitella parasitica]|nr:hypothetical protein BD408DRAFT_430018 [Parasitella parasitica]
MQIDTLLIGFSTCITDSLGRRIIEEKMTTSELVANLANQVNQTTKNLADFQAQFAETNLRDNNQLLTMIRSNETLRRELINMSNSVVMEHQAIQELSTLMYHKNSVTDAIVMIMRDLENVINVEKASLQQTNILQEEIHQEVMKNTQHNQRFEKRHDQMRDIMNANFDFLVEQFRALKTQLSDHITFNEDFREWAQNEIQIFSQGNNSTTELKAQVNALQKEVSTLNQKMRRMEAKMLNTKSCSCQDHLSRLEELEHKVGLCECHGFDSHQSRIEDLEQGIVNFRSDFAEHRKHFAKHQINFAEHEACFTQHQRNFAQHQDDFASYQVHFSDHQTRLERLEDDYTIQGIVTHDFEKNYATHDDLKDIVGEVKELLEKANLNVQDDNIDNL